MTSLRNESRVSPMHERGREEKERLATMWKAAARDRKKVEEAL